MRAAWISPAITATLLALAAPASASTLWTERGELGFLAGDERNQASLDLQPDGRYTVQDRTGPSMEFVPPCGPWQPGLGSGGQCPAHGVNLAHATLGSGNDEWVTGAATAVPIPVRLFGHNGRDTLVGGELADVIDGGWDEDTLRGRGGDDVIYAQDNRADTIECGDGYDRVAADACDTVAGDCEAAYDGPPPSQAYPPSYFDMTAHRMRPYRLRRALRQGLPARITCTLSCRVLTRVALGPRTANRLQTGRVIGRGRADLAPGTHVVHFRITSHRARRALRRLRSVRIQLYVVGDPATGAIDGEPRHFWYQRVRR